VTLRIVRSGTWLYDNAVAKPVDIIGLDYDWWYELAKADGGLEPGEVPEPLSHDGFLYYARFQRTGETSEPTWVDTFARQSIDAAMRDAQEKVPVSITWE
jgi:hypothetical protein